MLELSDGRLLSWADDKTLRLWTSDGTSLAQLHGHTARVTGALQLADGRLLSWSDDTTLRLWGLNGVTETVVPLTELAGHTASVRNILQLQASMNDVMVRLLSWADDKMLRLWASDGATGTVMALAELVGHTNSVRGALELSDGRLLSWSFDKTLRLWASDGTPLAQLHGHTDFIRSVLELSDGRLLSWSSDKTLRLWASDGMPLAKLCGHTARVTGALQLVDGRLLSWSNAGDRSWASGGDLRSKDTTLRLWMSDGVALAELVGHTALVTGALQLADGRLLSWSDDRTLRLWISDGTPLAELTGHTALITGALQLADGRLLSWSDDGTIRLWDSVTCQQIAIFHGDAPITCCAVLQENPLTVAAGDEHGRVMFLQLVE